MKSPSAFLPAALLLASAFVALADTPTPASAAKAAAADTVEVPLPAAAHPPAVYPVPYPPASEDQIKSVMDRVLGWLDSATPVRVFDRTTGLPVADLSTLPANPGLDPTNYPLIGYEWGVTYSGMLLAADVLGDTRYRDYVTARLGAIAAVAARQRQRIAQFATDPTPPRAALRRIVAPTKLDDCGSLCAAMIKTVRAGLLVDPLRPCIDTFAQFISKGQFRLADGTLARTNPLPHTLWLDDLYMSVPALAQMGALTGQRRYFDDAVRQVNQFSGRMFVPAKGLFIHGWAQEMDPHPAFYWARANGWAIVAMAELLSVLPEDHPGRASVLKIYQAQARGLAACQDKTGLWHQLLDRNDTYLETSASALYVYALARGVNRGWLNADTYGPMLSLGWNAIAQQVNPQGQIENVCVGTGMGFDPAFYADRPTSVWAAHGFGPVLLAGAEMIAFRRGKGAGAHVGVGGVQIDTPGN
jgi:rhamnogalacturonyl hydrolase YesR